MRRNVSLMGVILVLACSRNVGPNKPLVQGPTSCTTGVWHDFSATSTHPLGDNVCFQFDWAGQVEDFGPSVRSGEPYVESHSFDTAGTYQVCARARDFSWRISAWSSPLLVSVKARTQSGCGPPTGVAVSSGPGESDSTVVVAWIAPAEGPDKYMVYFRAVTDSGYTILGETTATSYTHNPHGMTGQYKVTAVFGAESYEGAEKPTTVPIHSGAVTLFEINADSSRCGYGWSRDSGKGHFYAMTDSANSAWVDFYVSDLRVGRGSPLYVISPNVDSIDSGAGIVPSAAWRNNGFSNPLLDEQ